VNNSLLEDVTETFIIWTLYSFNFILVCTTDGSMILR